MKCCNVYEDSSIKEVLGQTLRPGGFSLTEKSVRFCGFEPGDAVLDLGCGMGATVGYLYERYGIKAVGVDPSEKLIGFARESYKFTDFILGRGENIPFNESSFKGVFAECTLSLMEDLSTALNEIYRVLKKGGWLVITDVYAKNPIHIKELHGISINSCIRGLHDLKHLEKQLIELGFNIILLEDYSDLLKSLMVKIVLSYGSMDAFWNKTTDNYAGACELNKTLKECKPGYFLMIARKGDADYERYGI